METEVKKWARNIFTFLCLSGRSGLGELGKNSLEKVNSVTISGLVKAKKHVFRYKHNPIQNSVQFRFSSQVSGFKF